MQEKYNTIDYYNKNAKMYFEQTIEGDMQENYDRFLNKISQNSYILDFGCGSGRDSKYFIEKRIQSKSNRWINRNVQTCKFIYKSKCRMY